MAAIDDYVVAGFSYPKALALTSLATPGGGFPDAATTAANIDTLVVAGFSGTQAVAIEAIFEGGTDLNATVVQGLWAGTEAAAIDANM